MCADRLPRSISSEVVGHKLLRCPTRVADGSAAAEEAVVPCKKKAPDCDSNLFPETDHSLEGTKKSEVSAESCSI